MATQVQLRRGTATENNSFTGAQGELTFDTTNKRVRVHDGATAGGFELKTENSSGDTLFADNEKAIFGAGSDLQIYHSGTHSIINETGTGELKIQATNLRLQSTSGGENYLTADLNGAVRVYYDDTQRLQTTSTGIDVTGNATFADNGKAIFGAGSDLQIYHDGSASYIQDTGTGALYLQGDGGVNIRNAAGTENKAVFASDGAVTLYHDNAAKFATTSTGIDVTGIITTDGMTTSAVIKAPDGSAAAPAYTNSGDADGGMYFPAANQVSFASGGLERLNIGSGGDISFYDSLGSSQSFYWDADAESLGIGTSSPSVKLDVAGTVNAYGNGSVALQWGDTSALGSLSFDGSANPVIRSASSKPLVFQTNGANERMRIDSSGNVGIGTISPQTLLHLTDNSNGAKLRLQGNGGNAIDTLLGSVEYFNNDGSNDTPAVVSSINSYSSAANGTGGYLTFSTHDGTEGGEGSSAVERMRIDSSGNVLVGKTSIGLSTTGIDLRSTGLLQAIRNGGTVVELNRQTSDGIIIDFRKDGATVGSIGSVSSRLFIGSDDTFLTFQGASDRIYPALSSGGVRDAAIDLGYSSGRFKDIYATNGTIQTSDRNEKQDIAELSDAEQRVAVAAKGLLRKFRWKSAVEAKGDEARTHFGIIAQDLQTAFAAEGLDAGDYAMFISSTWTDEDTGEEKTRMGVRYSELLAFIIAAI